MDNIINSITYEKIERSIELLEFIVKEKNKDFIVDKNKTLKERFIECNKKFIHSNNADKIKIDYDEEDEN